MDTSASWTRRRAWQTSRECHRPRCNHLALCALCRCYGGGAGRNAGQVLDEHAAAAQCAECGLHQCQRGRKHDFISGFKVRVRIVITAACGCVFMRLHFVYVVFKCSPGALCCNPFLQLVAPRRVGRGKYHGVLRTSCAFTSCDLHILFFHNRHRSPPFV